MYSFDLRAQREEFGWVNALEADRLAVGLRRCADRTVVPIVVAAAAFVRVEGWKAIGYARQQDYERERLGRTGRWLRRMAGLGRAIAVCPELSRALTGEDGKAPIGVAKALLIASVATPSGVGPWIERARQMSVRVLEKDVRAARDELREAAEAARKQVVSDRKDWLAAGIRSAGIPGVDLEEVVEEPLARIALSVPRPVRAAFDEALELHRAVHGHDASIGSFVESLIADFHAGGDADLAAPPEGGASGDDAGATGERWQGDVGADGVTDRAPYSGADAEADTDADADLVASPVLAAARSLISHAERLFRIAGQGDAEQLHVQMLELVALEDELQKSLARVLHGMKRDGVFGNHGDSSLRFTSVGDYARGRLGMTAATAEFLVRLQDGVERHPIVADAYETGRLNTTKTSLVLRALGRGRSNAETQRAWVERAASSTTRRLRDEVRVVRRARDVDPHAPTPTPAPLDDESWLRSLRREPGQSFERIVLLGAHACEPGGLRTKLFVYLPRPLASELTAALQAARLAVARERARREGLFGSRESCSARTGQPDVPLPRIAPWQGLMRMILGFAATHDPPRNAVRRRSERIYERDGYRCTAPGCTARAELESHHVTYRSGGGGDEPANQTTLCLFHHRRGEHGDLMTVRGRAPLALTFRLGRGRIAQRFRNDLLLQSST